MYRGQGLQKLRDLRVQFNWRFKHPPGPKRLTKQCPPFDRTTCSWIFQDSKKFPRFLVPMTIQLTIQSTENAHLQMCRYNAAKVPLCHILDPCLGEVARMAGMWQECDSTWGTFQTQGSTENGESEQETWLEQPMSNRLDKMTGETEKTQLPPNFWTQVPPLLLVQGNGDTQCNAA